MILYFCTGTFTYLQYCKKYSKVVLTCKCKDIMFKYDFDKSESYSSTWVKVLKYLIATDDWE